MTDTLAPASPARTKPWAVQAHGLTKTFDDHRAVDDLNLNVPVGTIYGLLGPNGSGKTTRPSACSPRYCAPTPAPSASSGTTCPPTRTLSGSSSV